jgi:hypothetical protein
MPDLTRLLEARAELDQQLSRTAKLPAPPHRPTISSIPRRSKVHGGMEFLVWAGAAGGIATLALMSQGGGTPPTDPVAKTLVVQADAGGAPALAAKGDADSKAREALATRLRMAAATSSTGSDGLWDAVGWSADSDRTPEVADAYERSGNTQTLSAVSEKSGASTTNAPKPRAEPTVTGSIRPGGRPADPGSAASDGLTTSASAATTDPVAEDGSMDTGGTFSSPVAAPQEAAPQGAAPQEAAPQGAAPQEAAPEGAVNGQSANGPCELALAGVPEVTRAATAVLHLRSTCGTIPRISVLYDGHTFDIAPRDGSVEVDLFAGRKSVTIVDPRGGQAEWTPAANVFRGVAKAVLIWSGSTDLDLNAREYSARPGGTGFLRASQRGTLQDAAIAGRGFLSTVDDAKRGQEHVEVYTFLETTSSMRGEVAFGVEAKQCAPAGNARYETYLLVNGVKKDRNRSSMGSVACAPDEQAGEQRGLRGFQARLATPLGPI